MESGFQAEKARELGHAQERKTPAASAEFQTTRVSVQQPSTQEGTCCKLSLEAPNPHGPVWCVCVFKWCVCVCVCMHSHSSFEKLFLTLNCHQKAGQRFH